MLVSPRRWIVPSVLTGLVTGLMTGVVAVGPLPAPAASAARTVAVTAVDAAVGTDRGVGVRISCPLARACRGTVAVAPAGAGVSKTGYRVAAGSARTVTVRLTAGQYRKVVAKKRRASVTLRAGGKVLASRAVTLRAATASVALTSPRVSLGHEHVAVLALRCRATTACAGTGVLRVDGVTGVAASYRLGAGKRGTLEVGLSAAQVAALGEDGTWVGGSLTLAEKKPERVRAVRTLQLQMVHDHDETDGGHDEHGGSTETESRAYLNSWKPTEYDTCTVAEHHSYAATGPDGKLYPSWHPPVHTRADGSTCTFGHEHGDDPRNSDIYEWVIAQHRVENPAADGIPFGYGSERLTEYGNATGSSVHRHEDDPGQKVIVSNDQAMGVTFTDRWGDAQELVCDHLIKAHQGSHSSDATKNNTHELFYAVVCNDGTKLSTTVMSNYGNANELHPSCSRQFTSADAAPEAITTIGSVLPDGEGGRRLIPTAECVEEFVKAGTESGTGTTDDRRGSPASDTNAWWWAGYEQWQSFTSLTDAEGNEIARFEPWFGLQNPSRYYVANGERDTTVAYLNDLAWEAGAHQGWAPWREQLALSSTPIDRKSPQAWFNGAIRDAWITTTRVANADAATAVVYTDPWGKNASAEPFPGSIRSYISRTDNTAYVTTTTPSVTSRSTRTHEAVTRKGASVPQTMGFFYDYGSDAQGNSLGVHAPN